MTRPILHKRAGGCGSSDNNSESKVSASMLQSVAASMLPLYRAVATNRGFAIKWSKAVVSANLDLMNKLLSSAAPRAARQGLGINGIGYFIDFSYPRTVYTNGTTIPPGTVQFVFEPRVHQAIARAVLPLYRKLACDRSFACKLAIAIRRNNTWAVNALVRGVVCTTALKSVRIEDEGIALSFKYSFSRFKYRNLLFRESIFIRRRRQKRRLRQRLRLKLHCMDEK
ncbi:hypothetical protein D3C77_368620 [compost metagenome]